jgi:hypothetical protein
MVLSLAVVMAGVLAFFLFVMPHGHGSQPVTVVDDADVSVASFARQAPYPVLAPRGLAASLWKPTSLRVQGPGTSANASSTQASMTIGYVIDRPNDRTFARFEVTNQPDAVQALLGDRPATGRQTIAGRVWDQRAGDGHLALTLSTGGATVIVDDGDGSGGASPSDLTALAASVSPVPTTTS